MQSSLKKYYIVLGIIVFLVFGNTLSNGYNMDDNLVTQHHRLTSKESDSSFLSIFTEPYYKDDMGYSYGYRPLVTLSFAIEHQLFDESAKVSHFFNLLIYTCVVLLLFRFLFSYFGTDRLQLFFFTAVLFAVHPIHTEVVASIKNRDELLALLFSLLGALAVLKFIKRTNFLQLVYSIIFFSMAILSKKSIFPLIFILPFILVFIQQQKIKLILIFQLIVALPLVVFASDFDPMKGAKLYLLVLVFTGLLLLANAIIKQQEKLMKNTHLLSIITVSFSILFFGLFLYYHQYLLLVFSVVVSLFVIKKSLYLVISQNVIQLVITSLIYDIPELKEVTIFLSIGYLVHLISQKNWKHTKWFSPILVVAISPLFLDFNFNLILVFITSILFFILIFKKWLIGMLYVVFSTSIAFIVFKLGLIHYLLIGFTLIYFVANQAKIARFKNVFITVTVLVVFGLIRLDTAYFYSFFVQMDSSQVTLSMKNSDRNQLEESRQINMKEGRQLGYVENTLTAPHNQSQTIATGIYTLGKYGQLLLFPTKQSSYYGFSSVQTMDFHSVWVWLSFLFHIGLIIVAIYFFKKDKIITIGIFWYLVSILLFSNWTELVAGMVAERLAFTASVGFVLAIAAVVYYFHPTLNLLKPKKKDILIHLILFALIVITIKRNGVWKDAVTLFSNDLKAAPQSAQLNNMYALALMKDVTENSLLTSEEKKEYNLKAIHHFENACNIYPYSFNYYFDLGRSCILAQNFKKAFDSFEKAHQIVPKNIFALEELVKTAFDLKMKNETVFYGKKYLSISPNNVQIHELVAYICLLNKDMELTRYFASRANKLFPDNENFKQMLIDCNVKK
jgi:hypothetical protein